MKVLFTSWFKEIVTDLQCLLKTNGFANPQCEVIVLFFLINYFLSKPRFFMCDRQKVQHTSLKVLDGSSKVTEWLFRLSLNFSLRSTCLHF